VSIALSQPSAYFTGFTCGWFSQLSSTRDELLAGDPVTLPPEPPAVPGAGTGSLPDAAGALADGVTAGELKVAAAEPDETPAPAPAPAAEVLASGAQAARASPTLSPSTEMLAALIVFAEGREFIVNPIPRK
jgi:hypothetical protein